MLQHCIFGEKYKLGKHIWCLPLEEKPKSWEWVSFLLWRGSGEDEAKDWGQGMDLCAQSAVRIFKLSQCEWVRLKTLLHFPKGLLAKLFCWLVQQERAQRLSTSWGLCSFYAWVRGPNALEFSRNKELFEQDPQNIVHSSLAGWGRLERVVTRNSC